MRRVWLGAGLGLLVGLFVGVAFGWQMRNAAWRWGTAAEWATAIVTAAAALAALLFARNQINETRATAERQRHDELADRLEQAFFDQLKPRVKEFDGRWETALATAKTSYDAYTQGRTRPGVLARSVKPDVERAMATRRRVYISLARIHRLLGQLGDEPIEFTELHHAVHIRGPWVLPITAEGFEHFDPETRRAATWTPK